MSMKSFGRLPSGPKYGSSCFGAGAEEQHQLAALELARLAQAAPPLGHRAHWRASGAGADHHDRAPRMVRHEETHAERSGHLDLVADVEVAEIVADDAAHRAALVILQHPLHGERDVVVAGPLAIARAGDRILPRMMRSSVRVFAGRDDADRLPFEHRKRHRAEIEHDVMRIVVLAGFRHPNIADDRGHDRSRRGFRAIEIGVGTGGGPRRDHGCIGADLERRFFARSVGRLERGRRVCERRLSGDAVRRPVLRRSVPPAESPSRTAPRCCRRARAASRANCRCCRSGRAERRPCRDCRCSRRPHSCARHA